MYEAYWQLSRKPFEGSFQADFYYPSEVHQGALLKLRYVIENRRPAALLTGAAGTGKTNVVQLLKQQLARENYPIFHLVFPQLSRAEFLRWLADELTGSTEKEPLGVDAQIRRLEAVLRQQASQQRHAVLVVDEAQFLAECGTLETLRLLLNFEHEGHPLLTILLAGQTSLLPAIERLWSLEQMLAVKCLLRPFTLEETISYINHRLTAASAQRQIFENEALETIHHLSGGIARKINRLCDLALLIGYADEQSNIAPAQVEAVCGELINIGPEE